MKKNILRLLMGSIVFYLLIICFFAVFQGNFMFHPLKKSLESKESKSFLFQQITLKIEKGKPVLAWFKEGLPHTPAILYLHGNSKNLSYQTKRTLAYIQKGYAVLAIEYDGFGEQSGTPKEENMIENALAGFRFLRQKGHLVIVHGHSLGTAVALGMTDFVRPSAFILEAPFYSMKAMMKKRFFFLPTGILYKNKFQSNKRISKVSCPVLIIHGTDDKTISYQQGKALFNKAPRTLRSFLTLKHAGHNDLPQKGMYPYIFRWIQTRFTPFSI
ncbi:MAG: alpha/beta hydrolase [Alphaproteobacteria bacterium]|nr:alpha/beta hydrolase [Alphaproteobacteria bacterium]